MSNTESKNNKRPAESPFRDGVHSIIAGDTNTMQRGENGCLEYTSKGLGSDILAVSQMVRGSNPASLCNGILANPSSTVRDVADLIILLFVTRNARGGKGEKDLSFDMFLHVWKHFPSTAKKLLPLFPHYGYWKDLLLLNERALKAGIVELLDASITLMQEQLANDLDAVKKFENEMKLAVANTAKVEQLQKKGPGISLLAKWLPREGSHFDKTLNFVNRFTAHTSIRVKNAEPVVEKLWKSNPKASYRKSVAKLTAFLELPEVLLSAQRADEINFHKLASKATFKLSTVLLNESLDGTHQRSEDPKRIRLAEAFLEHLSKKGLKGGQLMPHEIVHEILKGNVSPMREKVLDAQWKSLWMSVVEQVHAKAKDEGLAMDPTRVVPLSDVSHSMYGTPLEVAIALGIGISEITHPAFRNLVLTFESQPRWHKLEPGDSIVKKVLSLQNAEWGGSTNFEAAYDQILHVCQQHNLSREDVPSLIVFSDMQFNEAAGNAYSYTMDVSKVETMHQVIGKKFQAAAESLGWENVDPTPIIYWNLRETGGHPVKKDTPGAVLLSGFSPSLLRLVMNGEALKEEEVEVVELDGTVRKEKIRVTPEEILRKMLDDPLYDLVRVVLAQSNEGILGDYEILYEEATGAGSIADGFELV